jgi:hypothetical protein
MSPNAGEGGSQPMRTAVHRSPNKLWRVKSIFNMAAGLVIFKTQSPATGGFHRDERSASVGSMENSPSLGDTSRKIDYSCLFLGLVGACASKLDKCALQK